MTGRPTPTPIPHSSKPLHRKPHAKTGHPVTHHSTPVVVADHGNVGVAVAALIVGLVLLRIFRWVGLLISVVGLILLAQWALSFGLIAWILSFGVIAGLIGAIVLATQNKRVQMTQFRSQPLIPIFPVDIVRKPNETFYWEERADWSEFHSEREYSGGYGGMSVRIARGLSLRSGSSRGRSRSVPVVGSTPGTVYLSDQRILFIGNEFSREVKLKSALQFSKGYHFVTIDLPNKFAVQVETGNERFGSYLDRILKGEIAGKPALPEPKNVHVDVKPEMPGNLAGEVKTKKWAVVQLTELLDSKFPELRAEYLQACTTPLASAGVPLTQVRSIGWIKTQLKLLNDLVQSLPELEVTDLTLALAESTSAESASTAQAKWLHECIAVCNRFIDWELDVKSANLDPLVGHAQTLMRGLSRQGFESVMNLRDQLAEVKSATMPKSQLEVSSIIGGAALTPLTNELDRLARLSSSSENTS